MTDQEASGARGFAAFPARKGGRTRGQSPWAGRWTDALEDTWPEEEPLKKGRADPCEPVGAVRAPERAGEGVRAPEPPGGGATSDGLRGRGTPTTTPA